MGITDPYVAWCVTEAAAIAGTLDPIRPPEDAGASPRSQANTGILRMTGQGWMLSGKVPIVRRPKTEKEADGA